MEQEHGRTIPLADKLRSAPLDALGWFYRQPNRQQRGTGLRDADVIGGSNPSVSGASDTRLGPGKSAAAQADALHHPPDLPNCTKHLPSQFIGPMENESCAPIRPRLSAQRQPPASRRQA